MLIHGLLAIFVADVAWFTDKRLADIALLYLALQALTAYATSGIVKLTSRVWRNGSGLMGVARTRTYGSSFAAGLNKRTATAMSWGVMSVEVAIPLVAFAASQEIVIALLVAGVMFHAIIALSMGLNTFVWGFVATYPAIWYTVSALRPW